MTVEMARTPSVEAKMGHSFRGFIVRNAEWSGLPEGINETSPHALREGLVLLPLTDALHDRISSAAADPVDGAFYYLCELSLAFGLQLTNGYLVYYETDYFGGHGEQAAALWRHGRLEIAASRGERGPINDCLSPIANQPKKGDAFDAVGLRRFRRIGDYEPST